MSVPIMNRRTAVASTAMTVAGLMLAPPKVMSSPRGIEAGLKELGARSGGRLGVAVLRVATGQIVGTRIDEHFAMCSTFKALAVAFVLARVDRGKEKLDRRIIFTEHELVTPFKATQPHVGAEGMSIEALCGAAITVSDSTAANLLLTSFGGPAGLTAYLRSLGDSVTRVDRSELTLNIVKPGEMHDTTTPRAMVGTLRRLLLGNALSDASRARLTNWMVEARDAATQRLRVGLPSGWRIANKPGTWEGIATNDVGVIWPSDRDPIVVAAYLANAPGPVQAQERVLADVARIIAEQV
jgi:beta-lactamase class A